MHNMGFDYSKVTGYRIEVDLIPDAIVRKDKHVSCDLICCSLRERERERDIKMDLRILYIVIHIIYVVNNIQ